MLKSFGTLIHLLHFSVPSFHVNNATGNICICDILDSRPYPYDPHGLPEPSYYNFDWEHDPPAPPPAYIVATPTEYERSSETEHTHNWLVPTGAAPTEVVRLKESVARESELRSEWALVGIAPLGEEGFAEGSRAFNEPWAVEN